MNPLVSQIIHATSRVILGKESAIRLAIACMLARGHLLIEDQPGMGKTTLSHTLAKVIGLDFKRVQFTNDLLPADILGMSVYDRNTASFTFYSGPVFTNVLLADEINRATPKTQSALLEVMEENQVSIDGVTRPLQQPFFVIATQNPASHIGTYALPESQVDRFMMRITLGYPDARSERKLLADDGGRATLDNVVPVTDAAELIVMQKQVDSVLVSDALLDYLQSMLAFTRNSPSYSSGLSPRAGLALKKSAQAWAFMEGRDFVIPEDVQAVVIAVTTHRLQTRHDNTTAASMALLQLPTP